ncbi:3-keto-5-aminohexanoate cleavage protein [Saccharopolyspora gloriosae]|uniref:3-keto-5-aminohexanoate cleavage protein n=1 Tax=Saccharopolyspora gloriosae TaxID=455344 RepID=UPI001FB80B10|nr:3-keto-5-aminohexanoate cleavage protein [Saccharopolyspora gloriosae]
MTGSPESTGTVLAVAPEGASGSVAQFVQSAAGCARVGAAVVDLAPVPGIPLDELVSTVREQTGLLVRVAATESTTVPELLACGAHALSCPLDAPPDFLRELRAGAPDRGTAVHFEARTSADLDVLREIPDPAHVILVFGPDDSGTVPAFASAMELVPPGTGCTAAGVGPAGLPVLLTALAAGAHVRIGRSDTPDYAPGTPARDDAQLVARAAGVAKIAQRAPLPPAQAAAVLGIKT